MDNALCTRTAAGMML